MVPTDKNFKIDASKYQKMKAQVLRWMKEMGATSLGLLGADFEKRWKNISKQQGDEEPLAPATRTVVDKAGEALFVDDDDAKEPSEAAHSAIAPALSKVTAPVTSPAASPVSSPAPSAAPSAAPSPVPSPAASPTFLPRAEAPIVEDLKLEEEKEEEEEVWEAPAWLSKPDWKGCDGNSLQPFQQGFKELIDVKRPGHSTRLLVAADTGMGKTLMMVLAMEEYFREKSIVVFVPNSAVKKNLFDNLVKFSNKFKKFFGWSRETKYEKIEADLRSLCSESEAARREKNPRKYAVKRGDKTVMTAGDKRVWIIKYTQPSIVDSIAKDSVESPLENRVIIADEFHNLFSFGFGKMQYPRQLEKIRELIALTSKETPLFAFTATPFGSDFYHDVLGVLRVVRGRKSGDFALTSAFKKARKEMIDKEREEAGGLDVDESDSGDENFDDDGEHRSGSLNLIPPLEPRRTSKRQKTHLLKKFKNLIYYLNTRPPKLFAQCEPPTAKTTGDFRPDLHLPNVMRVRLGEVVNVARPSLKITLKNDLEAHLLAKAGSGGRFKKVEGLAAQMYEKIHNAKKNQSSETLLHYAYPYQTCRPPPYDEFDKAWANPDVELKFLSPKLHALVKLLNQEPKLKTLVLCSRRSGLDRISAIVKKCLKTENRDCVTCYHYFKEEAKNLAESEHIKTEINGITKATGGEVTLANSRVYGEGVDWKGIDRLILLDIPLTTNQYVQNIGRVFRLCDAYKAGARRKVRVIMLMAALDVAKQPEASESHKPFGAPLTPDRILMQRLSRGLSDRRKQCMLLDQLSIIPLSFWGQSFKTALVEPERKEAWFKHDTVRAHNGCMWRKPEKEKEDQDLKDGEADDSDDDAHKSDDDAEADDGAWDKELENQMREELKKIKNVFPDLRKLNLPALQGLLKKCPPPTPANGKKTPGFYTQFDLEAVLQSVAMDPDAKDRLTQKTDTDAKGKKMGTEKGFLSAYGGKDVYDNIKRVYKESRDYFKEYPTLKKENTNFGAEVVYNVFEENLDYANYFKQYEKLAHTHEKLEAKYKDKRARLEVAKSKSKNDSKSQLAKLRDRKRKATSKAAKQKISKQMQQLNEGKTQAVKSALRAVADANAEVGKAVKDWMRTVQQLARTNQEYAKCLQKSLEKQDAKVVKTKSKKSKSKPGSEKAKATKSAKEDTWEQAVVYRYNFARKVWTSEQEGDWKDIDGVEGPGGAPEFERTPFVHKVVYHKKDGVWQSDTGKVWVSSSGKKWDSSRKEEESDEESNEENDPDHLGGDDFEVEDDSEAESEESESESEETDSEETETDKSEEDSETDESDVEIKAKTAPKAKKPTKPKAKKG